MKMKKMKHEERNGESKKMDCVWVCLGEGY